MKVSIRQETFMEALNKGASAALSKEAQGDSSNFALLIQSIKITASEKEFIIESNTDHVAVRYSVPVSEDEGVVVKEEGCILVPAKGLIDWATNLTESTINITLSKLDNPEVINTLEDMDISDGSNRFEIKRIGEVKFVSKGDKKTNSRWSVDCYEPNQVKSVVFSPKIPKSFAMHAPQLENALSKVLIAACDNDYEHILDSISIQICKNDLYFAATDTHRCAVYKVPSDAVSELESDSPMLIQGSILRDISKIINKDGKLSFSFDDEAEKVYISQKNLKIRLASTEKNNIDKFPNIKILLDKGYKQFTSLSKVELSKTLRSLSVVNGEAALFKFSAGKEILVTKAISENNREKPMLNEIAITSPCKDANFIWKVSSLIDGLKTIQSEEIDLCIPDNLQSVKMMSENDENIVYFSMCVESKLYDAEIQ